MFAFDFNWEDKKYAETENLTIIKKKRKLTKNMRKLRKKEKESLLCPFPFRGVFIQVSDFFLNNSNIS